MQCSKWSGTLAGKCNFFKVFSSTFSLAKKPMAWLCFSTIINDKLFYFLKKDQVILKNFGHRDFSRTSMTDQNGLRPQDIVIDRGVSTADAVLLLERYIWLRFNVGLSSCNCNRTLQGEVLHFANSAISTDSLRIWVCLVASHAPAGPLWLTQSSHRWCLLGSTGWTAAVVPFLFLFYLLR